MRISNLQGALDLKSNPTQDYLNYEKHPLETGDGLFLIRPRHSQAHAYTH